MNRLMQTASVLSFAAALAAAPVVAIAQQQTTETQAEQAVEETAQEAEEAAGEATEAAGEAADEAEQAVEETAQEAEQAVEGTSEATEQQADAIEEQADAVEEQSEEQADAVEEQSEEQADAIEEQGDQQADALEEQADAVEEQAEAGTETVEEVPGAIIMQDENSILAGDLIGATIYNAAGETVGEVDDAIISLDGTVEGVVIGVGGFLGLGEKNVAVEMAEISVQTDEDGDPQLVLDTTREALEAATEFVTVEDQQREAQATTATMPPAGGTAPAAGGMAPAGQAPAAPAEGTGTTGGAAAPTQ